MKEKDRKKILKFLEILPNPKILSLIAITIILGVIFYILILSSLTR